MAYDKFSAQGEHLQSMQNRITWMLRTTGPVLRIVHEHTSAPMGFENLKAILQMDKKQAKEVTMSKTEFKPRATLPVHPGSPPESDHPILVVDGLVARRLELTPADLATWPMADLTDEFRCLEGWSVPGLHWRGVSLATLLDAAGVAAQASHVQASAGGFSTPLTLQQARRALLATHLGDAPLAREHGGPVRLLVPGADCFTSIKWLDRIELSAQPGQDTAREIALGRLPPR